MLNWLRDVWWLVSQLSPLVSFLASISATLLGVLLGVYINGIIDRERERENEIFRPLLNEVTAVKEATASNPIYPILEDGEHRSMFLDIRPIDLHSVDPQTHEKMMEYLDALEELARLDDPALGASVLLHESGYGEFLSENLPDEILQEPHEGVQSGRWSSAPGPNIVSERQTVVAGMNSVLPSYSTKVSGDAYLPLLPVLVENASSLVQVNSGSELRAALDSHTDIDVEYLNEKHPNWADEIWETLQRSWEGDSINYEEGQFGNNEIRQEELPNMVEGEDFEEILASAGMALEARRINRRQRVINQAEQLYEQLVIRLSMALYHPKRILLASR